MPLDAERVRARFPGRTIVWLDSCSSTMIEAARLAAEGCPAGTAVGADEQTAGQGRFGRAWHSERDAGLYVSIVLRPALPDDTVRLTSLALGLATAEAIARAADVACDLRWPNDVLVGGKKCAGILVHAEPPALIAGIGINVNHSTLPEELAESATSLRLATGRAHLREALLVHLLETADSFIRMLVEGGREPVLRMFARASSYVRGKAVIVNQDNSVVRGITDGLDESGFLRLKLPEGRRITIVAGGVRPEREYS
jgi:BirA family biotin operon repressor/biotin-[acetyl-CoA-carboxylase] ligase